MFKSIKRHPQNGVVRNDVRRSEACIIPGSPLGSLLIDMQSCYATSLPTSRTLIVYNDSTHDDEVHIPTA